VAIALNKIALRTELNFIICIKFPATRFTYRPWSSNIVLRCIYN
jgi:hypothetical protein